jgi:hypothetical protein
LTWSAFTPFPTFGFLRPLFPGGGNIKQGLLVRSSHRLRKPKAISHELPIFI